MTFRHMTIERKTKKGFTLVETVVAILIFSISFTMLAATFSSFLKNYNEAKRNQRNVENAQYAMNLMAKTIRTSTLVSNETLIQDFPLVGYDHSQGACVKYIYDATEKKLQYQEAAGITSPADCETASYDEDVTDLTESNIESASVYAILTDTAAHKFGRVTISLSVGNSEKSFPIQMSVSLRQ